MRPELYMISNRLLDSLLELVIKVLKSDDDCDIETGISLHLLSIHASIGTTLLKKGLLLSLMVVLVYDARAGSSSFLEFYP